jgi:hypothetical protein
MRPWPVLCLAIAAVAGCSQPGPVQADVLVANHTGETVEAVVKVWDHEGNLVFERTIEVAPLAPGSGGEYLGPVTGPPAAYGAEYAWFAQAGDRRHQMERAPDGVQGWLVHVREAGLEFEFCATRQCA